MIRDRLKPRVFKAGGLWWVDFEFGTVSHPKFERALKHALMYATRTAPGDGRGSSFVEGQ